MKIVKVFNTHHIEIYRMYGSQMTKNSFEILSDMGHEEEEEEEESSLGGRGNNDQMAESGSVNGKKRHLNKSLIWIDLEMTGMSCLQLDRMECSNDVTFGGLSYRTGCGDGLYSSDCMYRYEWAFDRDNRRRGNRDSP